MSEAVEALKILQQAKLLLESRSEDEAMTALSNCPVLAKNCNLNCVLNKLKTESYENLQHESLVCMYVLGCSRN